MYKVFCFKLAIDLVAPQLASLLLEHSLWLPYLMCGVFLLLTFPFIIMMPETLHLNKKLLHPRSEGGNSDLGLQAYQGFLSNKNIITSLAVVFLVQLRYNAMQLIPIYTSVRFDWEISRVGVISRNC